MPRRYKVLDVFTREALTGNPLAVVLDSEGLDAAAMQRIAREFNLSETVFVLPPRDANNVAAVRIFTPSVELPFAGHPTVGTAVLLGLERGHGRAHQAFSLEEQIGVVPCEVRIASGMSGQASFTVPRLPHRSGAAADAAALAAALGLEAADVGCGDHVPSMFSAGVGFTFVPLRDLAAVARAQPRPEAWPAAFGEGSHAAAFVYTAGGIAADASFHARMFAPTMGVREDPATGAAAAAFVGVVHMFEKPADGLHRYVIEQGCEMGRPSRIVVTMTVDRGALVNATVGGDAVVVASGTLHV
jgi:trans-2,3-dihydro-3-hydroxyanthranilate isomerase